MGAVKTLLEKMHFIKQMDFKSREFQFDERFKIYRLTVWTCIYSRN